MAPFCLDKPAIGCESLPHDWLVKLGMDLASYIFDMCYSKQPEMMPFGHTFFKIGTLHYSVANHHPHPPSL